MNGQRRQFYRHSTPLVVQWDAAEAEGPLARTATTLDISGSGLSMYGSDGSPPGIGQWLVIRLALSDSPPMLIVGEVLREVPAPEGSWAVAVKFRAIDEQERDEIASFVSRGQSREIRRRRMKSLE